MADKIIIDVSEHNGKIDWEKVKAAGIAGAVIRCGFGQDMTKQDDKYFKRNADECSRLGIPFGIYLYSYAKTTARAVGEANHALRLAKGYKLSLPIFYDLEEQFTESAAASKSRVFIDAITKAGYTAGIYASASWFKHYLKNVSGAWFWVASWGSNNSKPQTKPTVVKTDIWQYTSRGKVNGINGNVDMNIIYHDFIGAGESDSAPSNTDNRDEKKKTVNELAKEVLKGVWGNGKERREKLESAGYDYDAVQKRVNELLAKEKETPEYYVIKKGDTLSKIAKAHNTTVAKLVKLNDIKDKNKIYAGDKIRIK